MAGALGPIDRADGRLPTSIAEARAQTVGILAAAGVPTPEVDSDLLVGHVIGENRGRVQAMAAAGVLLSDADAEALRGLVERRSTREPLQHITGVAPFRSIELAVGPGVFIPRPETELVAEFAIDALKAVPGAPIGVDLGTGSGAIALSMATEVPHAVVYGVEDSPDAFSWARRNFSEIGGGFANLVQGSLADALPGLDGTVDVVISNPPYIPVGAVPRDAEVRLFDPEHALYGGADGLDVVHEVSATAWRLLHPGGTLVLEHGELQGPAVAALLRSDGWSAISTHRDLLGRDRATTALR